MKIFIKDKLGRFAGSVTSTGTFASTKKVARVMSLSLVAITLISGLVTGSQGIVSFVDWVTPDKATATQVYKASETKEHDYSAEGFNARVQAFIEQEKEIQRNNPRNKKVFDEQLTEMVNSNITNLTSTF